MKKAEFSIFLCLVLINSIFSAISYEFRADSASFDPDFKPILEKGWIALGKTPLFGNSQAVAIDLSKDIYHNVEKPYLEKTFPVQKTAGFRFFFAFDSIRILKQFPWAKNLNDTSFGLLTCINDYYEKQSSAEPLFVQQLTFVDSGWFLKTFIYYPNSKGIWQSKTLFAINAKTPYCIENYIRLGVDSLVQSLCFTVNGTMMWQADISELKFRMKNFRYQCGNLGGRYESQGHFFLDNLAFGDTFPGVPPFKPVIDSITKGRSAAYPLRVRLYSPSYRNLSAGCVLQSTRYQIQIANNSWDLPYYDSGPDSLSRDSLLLSYMLPKDVTFFWRVKHYSCQGNESDWSDPVLLTFRIDSMAAELKRRPALYWARLSHIGSALPLEVIEKETWYDFTAKISSPANVPDLGYVVFWCSNASYPLGNDKNRGGRFLPCCNYVYNFSPDIPNPRVFEKNQANTYLSVNITGKHGAYIDATPGAYQFNPADSTIRFRVQFLSAAKEGNWSLRGYVKSETDQISPLLYQTFVLNSKSRNPFTPFRVVLLSIVTAILLALLAVYCRKGVKAGPALSAKDQEALDKFNRYIHDAMAKDIRIDDIEPHMSMSYSSINKLLNRTHGKSVKNYILDKKMEQARVLLMSTGKNVTEIMAAVGFNNISHFSRSFKQHFGLSPTDFKEKNHRS